jgi:hypothetical protein
MLMQIILYHHIESIYSQAFVRLKAHTIFGVHASRDLAQLKEVKSFLLTEETVHHHHIGDINFWNIVFFQTNPAIHVNAIILCHVNIKKSHHKLSKSTKKLGTA